MHHVARHAGMRRLHRGQRPAGQQRPFRRQQPGEYRLVGQRVPEPEALVIRHHELQAHPAPQRRQDSVICQVGRPSPAAPSRTGGR